MAWVDGSGQSSHPTPDLFYIFVCVSPCCCCHGRCCRHCGWVFYGAFSLSLLAPALACQGRKYCDPHFYHLPLQFLDVLNLLETFLERAPLLPSNAKVKSLTPRLDPENSGVIVG